MSTTYYWANPDSIKPSETPPPPAPTPSAPVPLDRFVFSVRGTFCTVCKEEFTDPPRKVVSVLPCGHAYHRLCGIALADRPEGPCPQCNVAAPTVDYVNTFPIDHGNDPAVRARLEQAEKNRQKPARELSLKQKMDVTKPLSLSKSLPHQLSKISITKEFLRENKLGMEDLVRAGVPLDDMHEIVGLKTWPDLLSAGLQTTHLSKRASDGKAILSLQKLSGMYGVTYSILKRDLGMKLEDLIALQPAAFELVALGLNVDLLGGDWKMTKFSMAKFRYPLSDWILLGLEKRHLYTFQLDTEDYGKLGWSILEVRKAFGISDPSEIKALGLSVKFLF
jgi:hypothetical protein